MHQAATQQQPHQRHHKCRDQQDQQDASAECLAAAADFLLGEGDQDRHRAERDLAPGGQQLLSRGRDEGGVAAIAPQAG